MNRLISVIGSVLVLVGLALLAYVGISYAQSGSHPARGLARSQQSTAKQRFTIVGHQNVAVPRSRTVTAAGEPAVRMVIPRIALDSPVVQTAPVGGVWEVADWSVGHLSTTPGPGTPGNGAYAAHDDIKGELFKRLGELHPGDTILLYTRHSVYHYAVIAQQLVDPSNVSVLRPTRVSTITLITCSPYWVDTQRLVVQARLKPGATA